MSSSSSSAPLALVSGGSSGIGLACARELLAQGYRVVLAARGRERLLAAQAALTAAAPGAVVDIVVLDVADVDACAAVVEAVERDHGPISFLVTSAGMCEPGLFVEQPLAQHLAHLQVNYIGTLALVHRVVPGMKQGGGGHIVLVSSAMAFTGVYGYAAYAPTKFALRGLGETLFTELRAFGIRVSVAFPPDTDTPQYRNELKTKPAAARVITASGGVYDADVVGRRIVRSALAGRFGVTHGAVGAFLRCAQGVLAPVFLRWQQRVAARELYS